MDWLQLSSINILLSVVSLGILLISIRKVTHSIRSSAKLDQKLNKATQGLDQGLDRAIAALRQEHQNLSAESLRIDAKIKEATLLRAQIDRSLAHLLQTRNQIQKENLSFNLAGAKNIQNKKLNSITATEQKNSLKIVAGQACVKSNGKNLPVFVMRKISKSAQTKIH